MDTENKRQSKKSKKEPYFGVNAEDAVKRYLTATSEQEKNLIYNTHLKHVLDKMIESIIRTYNLQRKNESFENIHADALSFLITKADKFDITAGKKAYSYYGTICKRYLIGVLQNDTKRNMLTTSYDVSSSENEFLHN